MTSTPFTTFLFTNELAKHTDDPNWLIVDCTYDLAEPDWGQENHIEGHIPGAVYAHMDKDLSSPITPNTGRHPLPDPEIMATRLANWGIQDGIQVVVYDTANGAFASRLWWMLKYYGHDSVAILEGGYAKWVSEDRPLTAGEGKPRKAASFTPRIRPEMLASWQLVENIRLDPNWKLVDARTPVRFRGEQEPIDTVAGHIPGALNRFHGENLTSEGTVKPSAEIRNQFEALLGTTTADHTVVYCGSGVTSCLHIAVMEHAGLGVPRLYAGSWSEWIRDPQRPIAKNTIV